MRTGTIFALSGCALGLERQRLRGKHFSWEPSRAEEDLLASGSEDSLARKSENVIESLVKRKEIVQSMRLHTFAHSRQIDVRLRRRRSTCIVFIVLNYMDAKGHPMN